MNYTQFLETQLRAAGRTAESFFGKVTPTTKPGDNNQVLTEADIAIGKQLVAAVQETYPDHNVIDEEAGVIDKQSRYTWVIDPIEATSNFAAGLPFYGIMVGLLEDAEPIAGGIIAPAMNLLYLAEQGKGATCNGEPIHASSETDLSKMLFSFGIDSHAEDPDKTIRECRMLADVVLAARNMRNTGCEALDPMYVAEGRLGARINMTAKIWDNVAPHAIVKESGGLWTQPNGEPIDYSNPLTKAGLNFPNLSAPPALHKQLVDIIKPHLQ